MNKLENLEYTVLKQERSIIKDDLKNPKKYSKVSEDVLSLWEDEIQAINSIIQQLLNGTYKHCNTDA